MNMFLWPSLTYAFQNAPLHRLSDKFLKKLDILIRSSVKEVLQIPHDIPNSMLYSSNKVKGLNVIRTGWEAFIQKYNATLILINCNCDAVKYCRDLEAEAETCLGKLNISEDLKKELKKLPRKKQTKMIREELKDREFKSWCKLPHKGKGVNQFQEVTYANKWIRTKKGLSSTEWTQSIKMIGNVVPVKSIPGRSLGSHRCRIEGCTDYETLAHVLGKCQWGELMRNNRHHRVRSIIAEEFRKQGWTVSEEQICTSTTQGIQRFDILVYHPLNKKGYMLDPTIRMEKDGDQAKEVNEEKRNRYKDSIPSVRKKHDNIKRKGTSLVKIKHLKI